MSISSTLTLLKYIPCYPILHQPSSYQSNSMGRRWVFWDWLLNICVPTCAGLYFRVPCTGLCKRWAIGCVNMRWKIVFPALTARRRTLYLTSYLYNHNLNTGTYYVCWPHKYVGLNMMMKYNFVGAQWEGHVNCSDNSNILFTVCPLNIFTTICQPPILLVTIRENQHILNIWPISYPLIAFM